ncbi:helix-turn-helix transcriptional regulator [Luteimonas sp. A277]
MNTPKTLPQDNPPLVGRVRIAQVVPVVGLSRPTIYRMIERGEFPRPQRISARASLYDAAEVCDWLRDPLAWAARNKAAQATPTAPTAADGWGQA